MKRQRMMALIGVLLLPGLLAPAAAAQDSTAKGAASNARPDSTPKKSGGLFGKVKGVAKNKVVQQVAKVAACNMVPGGQYIAGAIDASNSKGATGAAQGVAGATSGSNCGMPGVPGAGGMGPGMGAMGPMGAGMAGTNAAAAAAANAQMTANMAAAGAANSQANAQMVAAMQQMTAQMAQMGSMTSGIPTEAAGETLRLSGDPAKELGKGKLSIRHIDWMRSSPGLSPASLGLFIEAITPVAEAMGRAGGKYRIDIYVDQRYSEAEAATLGPQRISVIQSVLVDQGASADAVHPGATKRDRESRLEIIKLKP